MKKIDIKDWQPFTLESLFEVVKGSRLTKADMKEGNIRYIGATAFNNGITNYIGNNEETHPAGTLTVCYNGSIGQTYYQDKEFWATGDVNVLYPKFPMNKYIALFLAPLIKSVGRNYAYTDKWKIEESNDYNVVIGLSFIYSAMYIGIMLVVDLLYGVIDPRIRLAKGDD